MTTEPTNPIAPASDAQAQAVDASPEVPEVSATPSEPGQPADVASVATSVAPPATWAAPEVDAPPVAPLGEAATQPPALPATPLPEPPRALVPGAFLRLEFEIKQVVARGFTNLYLADGGDYGATAPKLIAEREQPAASSVAPASAAAPTEDDAAPSSAPEPESVSGPVIEDELEMTDGAMLEEALADHYTPVASSAPVSDEAVANQSDSNEAVTDGDAETPANIVLEAALFPPCDKFEQEEREYQVFDFASTTALQDYREPTNDTRYLQALDTLARGLHELEAKRLRATLSRDMLRFDAAGALRYYGFIDPQPVGAATAEAASSPNLEQLREINSFLLKRVFAESSTMRLGDEFGSLCLSEEVKEFARRLHEHELADVSAVVEAIEALHVPASALIVDAALLSDVGQERELNEDAGMIIKMQRAAHLGSYHFELYVVADGMGGHEGGEVASNLTLTSLQRNLATRAGINWNDNIAVRQALLDIIDAVNADVVALTETPHYRMMRAKPGSTLVFAVRLDNRVFVGNVGDSRAYKYNATKGLERVSKDHSYVQTLLDRGEITEEEAWDHPEGSIITANIGDPRLKTRDVFLRLFAPGDKLLLCSDGVVDMLRDRDIAAHLQANDAATVCRTLIESSNAAGGLDNITAVCVTFEQVQ